MSDPDNKHIHGNPETDAETYGIIGAAMRVHSQLGPGFLEAVYQEALEIEFLESGIPYQREAGLLVHYRGRALGTHYRADFVCHQSVIVELKAIRSLSQVEDAQVLHYLRATRLARGILLNFANPRLEYRRFINSPGTPSDACQ
jgi:GxxExxY protein